LALVIEDPRETVLQVLHAKNKDEVYKTLDIIQPMQGSSIGVVSLPRATVKKPEG